MYDTVSQKRVSSSSATNASDSGTVKTIEKSRKILEPQPQDILFGRGKSIQNRPSNVWFRNVLDSYRNRYDDADKVEKTKVAWEIVRYVKTHKNARFLKRSDDCVSWVEVDDILARGKVSHSFRTQRKGPMRLRQKI